MEHSVLPQVESQLLLKSQGPVLNSATTITDAFQIAENGRMLVIYKYIKFLLQLFISIVQINFEFVDKQLVFFFQAFDSIVELVEHFKIRTLNLKSGDAGRETTVTLRQAAPKH